MHRFRRRSGGLAEIVGTLMLVVIVVAAATAFSFFVASYQKTLQTQETQRHDKALEAVKVIAVSKQECSDYSPTPCAASNAPSTSFATLSVLVASLDVNTIQISGVFVNGFGVVNYTAQYANTTIVSPCYNASAHLRGMPLTGVVDCRRVPLPPYSTLRIKLDLDAPAMYAPTYALGVPYDGISSTSDLSVGLLTGLTNYFVETFSPPVAIASIFFVSNGSTSVPVFDGLSSYQSAGADNVSILWYNWTATSTDAGAATCGPYSGAEFEASCFTEGATYTIVLEVTNTDGLSGSISLAYTQPK